jgi:copper transport protein
MLAVVAGALGGHQAAITPLVSLPANGLHLGAAAVWVGGVLLLGVWPATRGDADGGDVAGAGWTFARVARSVSSAALLASGVILVTAIVQDVLYLPSIGALFSSTYGNLLLAKSAGFGALVAFGAYNRFRLIPMLSTAEDSGRPLRRSVRFELVVMIVVVLVAVALGQVPPPTG